MAHSDYSQLDKAILIAIDAHRGQTDKGDNPYISHPLRVMNSVDDGTEKIVAILHDVVEDSNYEFEDIEKDFSVAVVEAVRCVTKREEETYSEFIERCKDNEIARKVKIADIEDNLDISRIESELDEQDLERLEKYRKALSTLKEP